MSVYDDYQFVGFNLFIHEKGQFWPKNIFKPIKKFFINPNKLKTYSFFIQKDQKVMVGIVWFSVMIVGNIMLYGLIQFERNGGDPLKRRMVDQVINILAYNIQ